MNESALFKFTQGLYILGGRDGKRFVGSVVDAVMQVANKPLVIALSCNNNSYTRECIDHDGIFSLSVLGKSVDPLVIGNFGFQTSRKVDKWDNVDYEVLDGLPYLMNNIATVRGTILQKIVFESNTLFIAEVCGCESNSDEEPLTYLDYRISFKDKVMEAWKNKQKEQLR